MRIGITYDTVDMYDINMDNTYYDFAEQISIENIKNILNKIGHSAELVGNTSSVIKRIKNNDFKFDLIYNTVEGFGSRNREGLLPAILESYKIPYIGTDSFGLSLTLNKYLTKILAEKLDICTPNYLYVDKRMSQEKLMQGLKAINLPIIIKPNFEGNSSGICVANNLSEAIDSVKKLLIKYNTPILCEEFIFGTEVTVPIIGNDENNMLICATTVDIQKDDSFWLDVNCKVFGDYRNILIKSRFLNEPLFQISKKMFFAIGCHDFARFDFRVDNNNRIYFIEANPLPALFTGGSFDILGQSYGISYMETIGLIIKISAKRLGVSL